jgi:hypothetical protein
VQVYRATCITQHCYFRGDCINRVWLTDLPCTLLCRVVVCAVEPLIPLPPLSSTHSSSSSSSSASVSLRKRVLHVFWDLSSLHPGGYDPRVLVAQLRRVLGAYGEVAGIYAFGIQKLYNWIPEAFMLQYAPERLPGEQCETACWWVCPGGGDGLAMARGDCVWCM